MDRLCTQGSQKGTQVAHQTVVQLDRLLLVVVAQPGVRFNRVIHSVCHHWRKADGQCGIYGHPTIQYDQVVRPSSVQLYSVSADKIQIGCSISSPRS